MPEYIDREAVLGMLKQECSPMVFAYLADLVNDIPAADVASGRDYRDCRNELCLRCGQYKEKHLGACNGCRWEH